MVQTFFFNSFRIPSSFSEYRTVILQGWSQQYFYQAPCPRRSSSPLEWSLISLLQVLFALTSQIDNGFWFSSYYYKDEIKNFFSLSYNQKSIESM